MNSRANSFIVSILALMLVFVNVWSYSDNFISAPFKKKNTNSTEYFFESGTSLCLIQRTKETSSNILESLYSINYKKVLNYTNIKNQIFEQNLSSITYQFVKFLSKVDLSCSVKQLIYPFNYFW